MDETGDFIVAEGSSPIIDVYVGTDVLLNEKIRKLKYYLKDINSDIWYLQFWVDIEKNEIYAATSNYSNNLKNKLPLLKSKDKNSWNPPVLFPILI